MSPQQVFSDRYELVRHIARGGMAQVYLAQDLLLDRPVALKVLFPELSIDQSFVERFRREAQAAANLSHPNIVSIYDWGQGDHTYFIVMEYIDGRTLSSMIRDGPIDAFQAAAIGADVAKALDFAHRHNVIHRDVKPGNVLIDASGQVKVTDFGIARAVGAKEGLTQTGAVMGTATYFSPEQAQGYSVDSRSDVYSLGVVLYEMVVGRPPFDGDNPVSIAYKHVREEPVLPGVANAEVPAAFEGIVMQALAKDTEGRYQTADALGADLVRFGLGEGVLAPEASPTMVAATGVLPPAGDGRMATAVVPDYRPALVGADQQRSRTSLYAGLLLALLAVLGVLVFFLGRQLGLWGSGTATPATLRVPGDLVGQQYPAAHAELTRDGFTDVTRSDQASNQPVGAVLGSTPPPNARLRADKPLSLAVSQGPVQVGVPDEVNNMVAQAQAELTAKGFKNTVVTKPATQPAGTVVDQMPPGGASAPQASIVTLVVSGGPATVTVPPVAGEDAVTAASKLTTLGLVPQQVLQSSTMASGTVISTMPGPGAMVSPNTTVVLFVSTGPKMVAVPNVDNMTLAMAENLLNQAGLSFTTTMQAVTNPAQDQTVLSSNPPQGMVVNQGTSVSLVVGQYSAPATSSTVPSSTTTTTGGGTTTTAPGTTTTTKAP
ncbi:MAG: Stk1 family PASTA domain-containing Ser/Thr kinase [Acidimicrobiales bacterium]